MRTCGLSVAAYFVVSESERYGSTSRKRPPRLSRKPLWPSHHSASPAACDVGEERVVGEHRLDHSSSLTARTPATRFASFCRAAQRAVCDRPQSGAKDEPLGRRVLEEAAHALGDVLGRLDVVALHVDDADGHVEALGDLRR